MLFRYTPLLLKLILYFWYLFLFIIGAYSLYIFILCWLLLFLYLFPLLLFLFTLSIGWLCKRFKFIPGRSWWYLFCNSGRKSFFLCGGLCIFRSVDFSSSLFVEIVSLLLLFVRWGEILSSTWMLLLFSLAFLCQGLFYRFHNSTGHLRWFLYVWIIQSEKFRGLTLLPKFLLPWKHYIRYLQ